MRRAGLVAFACAAFAAVAGAQAPDPLAMAADLNDLEVRALDELLRKDGGRTPMKGEFRRRADGSLWLSDTNHYEFTANVSGGKTMKFKLRENEIGEVKFRQFADAVYAKRFQKRFSRAGPPDRGALVDFGKEGLKEALASTDPEFRRSILVHVLKAFAKVVEVSPDWSPGYVELGDVHRRLFDRENELAAYRMARRRGAANDEVWAREGSVLESLGLLDDAEAAYREALKLAPLSGAANLGLGRVCLAQNRAAEAKGAFELAIRAGGAHAAAAGQGLGRTLLRLPEPAGGASAARQVLERARDVAPDDAAIRGLSGGPVKRELMHDAAVAALCDGDASGAVTALLGVLDLGGPPTPPAAGDTAQRLAADFDPFRARAFASLAIALARTSPPKLAEAREACAQAAALDPTSAGPYVALAACEEADKRYGTAADAYRRALETDPQDGPTHLMLGQLLFRAGRADEAQKSLEEAIRLLPDSADALTLLGHVALAQQRDAHAVRYLRRALDLLPTRADLHAAFGVALLRQGEYEGARAAFQKSLDLGARQPGEKVLVASDGLAWLDYTQAKGKRDRGEDRGLSRWKQNERESTYAQACIELVMDTRGKQVWTDDFERTPGSKVANRWLEEDSRGIQVALDGGRARFVGKLAKDPDEAAAELVRAVDPQRFVAGEGVVLALPGVPADIRLTLMVRGADGRPTGGIYVGKNRRDELVHGQWNGSERRWTEVATGRSWPASSAGEPTPVRIRLERLVEKGKPRDTWRLSVDGQVVADNVEAGFRIGRDLHMGVTSQADLDARLDFAVDDFKLVERKQ